MLFNFERLPKTINTFAKSYEWMVKNYSDIRSRNISNPMPIIKAATQYISYVLCWCLKRVLPEFV